MAIQQAREPYAPYRFTVDEYYRMVDADILTENTHVELIDGQILVKEPSGPPHAGHVGLLTERLIRIVGDRAIVRAQTPVQIDVLNHPEPDVTLAKPRTDHYMTGHPMPEDVLLVIEIAYSSARADRKIKAPLYGRAGIPEFWLIDLPNQKLEVYGEPGPSGYNKLLRLDRTSSVTPTAFPDLEIAISDILRPVK